MENKIYILQRKGSVFYVASGIPHEYYPLDGKWSTCWVVFRGESLSVLMKRLGFVTSATVPSTVKITTNENTIHLFEEGRKKCNSGNSQKSSDYL